MLQEYLPTFPLEWILDPMINTLTPGRARSSDSPCFFLARCLGGLGFGRRGPEVPSQGGGLNRGKNTPVKILVGLPSIKRTTEKLHLPYKSTLNVGN